jgi:M6 family metalloprotease-like protein
MKKAVIFLFSIFLLLGCDSTDNDIISSNDPTNQPTSYPTSEPTSEPTTYPSSEPTTYPQDGSTTGNVALSPTTKKSIPMLAVLVSYNNIQISSSKDVWSQKLFGTAEGQLNDYYKQASNGNFQFTPIKDLKNGTVLLKLNKNHPNIDVDNYTFDSVVHPDLKAALTILDEYIDYSNYDTDANGAITPDELLLTFIIAGYEDSYAGGHINNGIWAHQSCVSNSSSIPILDGVTLMSCADDGNFALFGERHYYPPDSTDVEHDATIGIIAHELGHSAFHLPDLYNTQDPNTGGVGIFGLMGGGTWSAKNSSEYPGATPSHFSAWSKVYNRWITPTIEHGTSATLTGTSSIETNIIKIPIDNSNYYLLENRDNNGYDRGLYTLDGHFKGGIAIWKIDETKLTSNYLFYNAVNADNSHKGVDIVEAYLGNIDSAAAYGDENALYYDGNKNYFLNLVSDISAPGSVMNLNIH